MLIRHAFWYELVHGEQGTYIDTHKVMVIGKAKKGVHGNKESFAVMMFKDGRPVLKTAPFKDILFINQFELQRESER